MRGIEPRAFHMQSERSTTELHPPMPVTLIFFPYEQRGSHWLIGKLVLKLCLCLRPYHVESTSSRPITEVKQHRVVLVLGWVTAWEYTML